MRARKCKTANSPLARDREKGEREERGRERGIKK